MQNFQIGYQIQQENKKAFLQRLQLLRGCFPPLGGFSLLFFLICLCQECQITQEYDSFSFKEQLQPPKMILVLPHQSITFIIIFHRLYFFPNLFRSIYKKEVFNQELSQCLTVRCFLSGWVRKTETMIRHLKWVSNTDLRLALKSGYILTPRVIRRNLQCLAEDFLYSLFYFFLIFYLEKE